MKRWEIHFSRQTGTHTLGGDSRMFPINPSVPAHTRLCTLPGWSPSYDYFKCSWTRFWKIFPRAWEDKKSLESLSGISHTAQEHLQWNHTEQKQNPTQLFLVFDMKQLQISNKQPRTGQKIHLWMCFAFTPRLCLTVHFIMSRNWIKESRKIEDRAKKNPFVQQRTHLWDNGDWNKWPGAAFLKPSLLLKSRHNISFHLYPALHSGTKK